MNDTELMQIAIDEAVKGLGLGDQPFGAVLAKDGEVIQTGRNIEYSTFDPTAHAEVIVIREAARVGRTLRLVGYSLYVTLEPCAMCAQAISLARIQRLYFGASDKKSGAVENGVRLYNDLSCHHRPEVYGGLNALRAEKLLQNFFRLRR